MGEKTWFPFLSQFTVKKKICMCEQGHGLSPSPRKVKEGQRKVFVFTAMDLQPTALKMISVKNGLK